jgi:hypothetical protein
MLTELTVEENQVTSLIIITRKVDQEDGQKYIMELCTGLKTGEREVKNAELAGTSPVGRRRSI